MVHSVADKNKKIKKDDNIDNYYRYLSDEDFTKLEAYKHYAPKTAYELWLIKITGHIE
jgi:hypothetical protein